LTKFAIVYFWFIR